MARSVVECHEIHRDIAILLPHGIAMATDGFFFAIAMVYHEGSWHPPGMP